MSSAMTFAPAADSLSMTLACTARENGQRKPVSNVTSSMPTTTTSDRLAASPRIEKRVDGRQLEPLKDVQLVGQRRERAGAQADREEEQGSEPAPSRDHVAF